MIQGKNIFFLKKIRPPRFSHGKGEGKSSDRERLNTGTGHRSGTSGSGLGKTGSAYQNIHAMHKTGESYGGGISVNLSEKDIGVFGKGMNPTPKSREVKKNEVNFVGKDSGNRKSPKKSSGNSHNG